MPYLHNFRLPVVILSLGCATALGMAQTGPVGSGQASPPAVNTSANTNTSRMTPDQVANLLRKQGHQVEVRESNGVVELICTIRQDGWTFQVEVQFNKAKTAMTFLAPLGNPLSQYSAAQLLDLLKQNYRLAPAHFVYREKDRRICLEECDFLTIMNETQIVNCLNRFLKDIRESHSTWGPIVSGPVS